MSRDPGDTLSIPGDEPVPEISNRTGYQPQDVREQSPWATQSPQNADDRRGSDHVIAPSEKMDRLSVRLRSINKRVFPGSAIDRCIVKTSLGIPIETESDEPTAHRAVSIEEDDVRISIRHPLSIRRHPVAPTGCLRFVSGLTTRIVFSVFVFSPQPCMKV